ncbi:MAG: helix-turn-helix transcriptional regulator [Clostridiales bacterium]|nr:helix-turn-helix transcriptional regulator [Clostridiales bacterium]
MISYEPLWKTMAERHVSQYALIHKYNFDPHTLQRLRENKSITVYTIERLCSILNCTPNDIFTFADETNISNL